MTTDEQRAAVVAVAKSWVGTAYHHMGRIKGVGVDCGTLIEQVYMEAGVKLKFDIPPYSTQWHLHTADPVYERLLGINGYHLVETPGLGDIALFKVARQHAHGAIVTDVSAFPSIRIAHAFSQVHCVVDGWESEFGELAGAPRKFFSMW